jgi:sigma-B regulation protein RsbU (phosphoserine phosphatase)
MKDREVQTSKGDILIVDDTPANLRVLAQMLSERNYRVRAVTSGARALEAAQAASPDLVLLDVKMPGMDGYEVCQRMKADQRTRETPIIFISALDDVQDKVRAFTAGGVDYVTKPFQWEEVLARIETHLALRSLQRQLQDANKRFERELALAGATQASFLPKQLPDVPGWQLAVTLIPARQTSGDFYDVAHLSNGRLGILVADVADKGAGAALYMALSWTLIRTYISEYPTQPERVLSSANHRILTDTDANQFVTAFYGILDPRAGELAYCNAGHNPPYLVSGQNNREVRQLTRTGIPLGIFDDQEWEQAVVHIAPGDALVLYTDGVTDAENGQGIFFGEDRLLDSVRANIGGTADEVRNGIIADVHQFVGSAPQLDDIALVVVTREG